MKKIVNTLAIAAAVLSMASCANENVKSSEVKGNGYVDFQVGETNSIETKSGAEAQVIVEEQIEKISLSENEEEDLFLVETVSDLDAYLYAENPVNTKGTPIYTENFASKYKNIGGKAYSHDDSNTAPVAFNHTPDEFGLVKESPLRYRYDFGAKNMDWPEGKDLLFYLSAPNWDEISSEAVDRIKYGAEKNSGTRASWNTIDFDFTTPQTAEGQVDYLFTSRDLSFDEYHQMENTTPVVLFYHALAGVKFKTAKAGDQITVITKVEITNINSTGHCTITPTYEAEGYTENNSNATPQVTKSAGCVAWTGVNTPIKFELAGLTKDNVVTSTEGQFPTSFNGTGTNTTLNQNNLNDASFTKTFFFIPQTTSADTQINIYYDIYTKGMGTKIGSYKRVASFKNREWKAGVLYTYTLSPNHVTVAITDEITNSDKVKENVVIKNTGNTDSYIRVALVGNWYDTHSPAQIVSMWHETDSEGTFVTNGAAGMNVTDWVLGTDGFYYYKYIVKAGETLKHPLFDTFTVGTAPGELATTAHLELDILVQAVDAAKISSDKCPWYKAAFTTTYDN